MMPLVGQNTSVTHSRSDVVGSCRLLKNSMKNTLKRPYRTFIAYVFVKQLCDHIVDGVDRVLQSNAIFVATREMHEIDASQVWRVRLPEACIINVPCTHYVVTPGDVYSNITHLRNVQWVLGPYALCALVPGWIKTLETKETKINASSSAFLMAERAIPLSSKNNDFYLFCLLLKEAGKRVFKLLVILWSYVILFVVVSYNHRMSCATT